MGGACAEAVACSSALLLADSAVFVEAVSEVESAVAAVEAPVAAGGVVLLVELWFPNREADAAI